MPRVPIIQEKRGTRAQATGSIAPQLQAPRLSVDTRGPVGVDAVGQAQVNFAKSFMSVGDVLGDIAQDMRNRADQTRLIEAQGQVDAIETELSFDPERGYINRKGKDAFGIREEYVSEYNDRMNQVRDSLGNDAQRAKFDQIVLSRRRTFEQGLLRQERQQMEVFAKSSAEATANSGVNRAVKYWNRPEVVNSSIQSAQAAMTSYLELQGAPQSVINERNLEIESNARLGVLQMQADNNPGMAIKYYEAFKGRFGAEDLLRAERLMDPTRRQYNAGNIARDALSTIVPAVSEDSMMNFVINDIEGGDAIVPDGDGIAKYGINSAANPDVDVENLTEDQARALYKERYWDKIGADDLPVDTRLVAFDAAVNHGVGKAKEMLAEAGGDARRLLELRAAEYERLARENPEKYGQYLDGWKNRLTKITAQIDTMRGDLPSEFELSQKIDAMTDDVETAADAKKMIKSQITALENDRKRTQEAASEEAHDYLRRGEAVPASVEARMNPEDVIKMRKSIPGDPAVYAQVRQQILLGVDVDLPSMRWELGNNYEELVKLQQDPSKRHGARKVEDVVKSATRLLIGKTNPQNEKEFQTVETFRRAIDDEIDGFQRDSGKTATADDVQKMADRLLLSVTADSRAGVFGRNFTSRNNIQMFELQPGEVFELPGVPMDRNYYVGGASLQYPDLVRNLRLYLESRSMPVNNDNMEMVFELLVEQGQLVQRND